MLKRMLAVLACAGLVASMAVTSHAAPLEPFDGTLDLDDHNLGHLHYPAVERAQRFTGEMERLEARGLQAEEGGDYGKAGCEAPAEYEVGDTRTFWVSQQQLGNTEIEATLAAKSPHGYMWVQSEFYLPLDAEAPEGGFVTTAEAEAGLEDWETIYEIDRKYFGHEPNPTYPAKNLAPGLPSDWRDADCDEHVSILNFPIDVPGANGALGYIAGYFSSEHEYPNGDGEFESPFSNETEMFFMNSAMLNVGDETYAGVLAHEFYHMIQFSNDYNEETWVNEGMADVAAVVNGFGDIVEGHISGYEETPDQHLIDWTSTVDDYGQAFLFFDYLFNHYGEPDDPATPDNEAYLAMANLLTRTPEDGLKGVTKVMKARPKSVTKALPKYFRKGNSAKVFRDYLVANYLDDPEAASGQFGYANRDVSIASAGSDPQSADDANAFPYGGDTYEFGGDQEGTIDLSVEDPVTIIPATEGQPAPEGGFFAWGNRGDELITWLQREADLTDATTPALVFDYWHLIEEDWDYAYVRVSEDDGNSWNFINTAECGGRATDPNGNNRAVTETGGITGDSGGWQQCTLDLTAYAGKRVLVRWEYDTDQAVTEPGYVVDNVQLTDGDATIWSATKFEKAKQANKRFEFGGDGLIKWIRMQPLAKNKPLIQVVNVSGDDVVRKVYKRKAFKKGEGITLKRRPGVKGERTILIVTSTTPIATETFTYRYGIQ